MCIDYYLIVAFISAILRVTQSLLELGLGVGFVCCHFNLFHCVLLFISFVATHSSGFTYFIYVNQSITKIPKLTTLWFHQALY